MRIGLDGYTLPKSDMTRHEKLDYVAERGFVGLMGIFGLEHDIEEIRRCKAYADELGLYTFPSIPPINPHLFTKPHDEAIEEISDCIRKAAELGWSELHTRLGGPPTRCDHSVPWARHLQDTIAVLLELKPLLLDCGCRIDIENKGDITTYELARIAEEAGPEIAGICLDTANVVLVGEDPLEAAKRAAPYTHQTHVKDCILYFSENGLSRQVRPPGEGIIDWEQVLTELGKYSPDLTLFVEDHKMIFDANIFDPDWFNDFPGLNPRELAQLTRHAWHTQQRIQNGEISDPEEYESVPYAEQREARLRSAREYLSKTLKNLGLDDERTLARDAKSSIG